MSPHYLVKFAQIFHLFHFFTCIEYQFAIRSSCWTAASCCDMGWISAEGDGLHSWSVAKKTGSMYPCRMWSLWTFAVMLLAWRSICCTLQPVLFRATNANPQPAHSRATNVWRNTHTFSQMKILCRPYFYSPRTLMGLKAYGMLVYWLISWLFRQT